MATKVDAKEVVELRLSKGVDLTAEDKEGLTPIQCAEKRRHTDLVNLLRQSVK
jgi:ankyrin repeat protein